MRCQKQIWRTRSGVYILQYDNLFPPLIQTLKLSPRSAWMTQLWKLVPAVWKKYQLVFISTGIDQSHKSYNALAPYPTIHHIGAEIWIYVCLYVVYCDIKERCIVRFCPFLFQHGFLWDNAQMHWGICAIVPSSDLYNWPITRSVTIYFLYHCLYRFIIFSKNMVTIYLDVLDEWRKNWSELKQISKNMRHNLKISMWFILSQMISVATCPLGWKQSFSNICCLCP